MNPKKAGFCAFSSIRMVDAANKFDYKRGSTGGPYVPPFAVDMQQGPFGLYHSYHFEKAERISALLRLAARPSWPVQI
ncbi:hypothetical protein [uncultured Cohaesibacter sp.]|uniref:hypothetical protein n=1 Tax=uncultured Cohaesibacter sp. TaxID=1002546 RepID=UPI002AAB604B|nr:hypothetical protein [uncultured Cohaesibacter sp.]